MRILVVITPGVFIISDLFCAIQWLLLATNVYVTSVGGLDPLLSSPPVAWQPVGDSMVTQVCVKSRVDWSLNWTNCTSQHHSLNTVVWRIVSGSYAVKTVVVVAVAATDPTGSVWQEICILADQALGFQCLCH